MIVFALLGETNYEGHALLGIYTSREEAEAAFEVHEHGRICTFDHMVIEQRVIGAAAEMHW